MKKILITLFVISMLAVSVGFVFAAKPDKFDSQGNEVSWAHNDCTKIQDGTLLNSNGEVIMPGYDAWGYNYQAHMFNGWYHNSPRPDLPYTKDTIDQAPSKTWLIMKWSDEWLANTDCNNDSKLDRGYSCDPENPISSACGGAWETNHQFGSYEDEDGETCYWNYFVKIVYVNPNNAYKAVDPEDDVEYWYTNDGEKIGSVLWGAYARILQIYNDPCAGETGVENKWETPAGFGFYKPKLILVETIQVYANDPDPVYSTIELESGVEYELEAMGTALAGDTIEFDAKYSITNRISGDGWTDSVSGYESYGTELLDLFVDGSSVDWGVYNTEHTYYWTVTGTDAPVELLIYDIHYPNNVGFITVNIYERQ